MKDTVKDYLDKKKRRKSRQKKVVATLLSLSVVVATGVTWSLHQTGESLTGETFCGKTEHTHTEACLKKDTKETDTKTEMVLTCTLPEHTHTDACITKTLICGQEESAGHTHSVEAGCYQDQQVLTCTQEEHVHGEGCYDADGNLICTTPEHTHGEGCYTTEQVLVCTQPESAGHVHTDACYQITYTCGMEEHTHTDACYTETTVTGELESADISDGSADSEYTCGLEEHKHTLQCYSNPNADLETAEVWAKTFANVTLTGDYGKDVVAIAKTQLGYHESTANYNAVKNDSGEEFKKGYTRYGAWYGSPYEDWCAMFASFCINYAHVQLPDGTAYPLEASCPNWINTLSRQGRYATRDAWTPAIGDLVFLDQNGDGTSDHVGIVEALTKDGSELGEDVDLTTADGIKTIEGNSSDQVAERSYSRSDSTIMGYGVLPVKEDDTNKLTLIASTEDGSVSVTAKTDVANLPEGAALKVAVLNEEQTLTDVAAKLDEQEVSYDGFVALDVTFVDSDGNEVEPNGSVDVSMELAENALPAEADAASIEIQHLEENEAGEVTAVETVADTGDATDGTAQVEADGTTVAEFTVDGFSTFTITFKASYGNTQYVTIDDVQIYKTDGTEIDVSGSTALTVNPNFGNGGGHGGESQNSSVTTAIRSISGVDSVTSTSGETYYFNKAVLVSSDGTETEVSNIVVTRTRSGYGQGYNQSYTYTYSYTNAAGTTVDDDGKTLRLYYAPLDYGTSNLYFYVNVVALPEGSNSLSTIDIGGSGWVDAGATTINSRSETSNLGTAWHNAFATDTVETGQPFASGTYNIGENTSGQNYIYGGGTDSDGDGRLDTWKLSDINAIDSHIRNELAVNGETITNNSGSYTYKIGSIPSNESVISEVQKFISGGKSVTVNGKNISADDMTTANFTVKWYVVKDSQGTGWHCDGYLVAKTAYMKVTKTFAGNSTAITGVKEKTGNDAYSISVTGDSTNDKKIAHNGYSLGLTAAESSTKSTTLSGSIGYDPTESDPDNNYYVWYVPVDYLYDYSVTENNWQAGMIGSFTYETAATYSVNNSADSTDNKSGTYSDTDTPDVRGTSSATSSANPLTVQFQNVYTPDGTVAIHKVDSTTGNGWSGVTFTITDSTGKAINVTKDPKTGYYMQVSEDSGTNIVETDAYGMIYLKDFPSGDYVLTETTPEGYQSIGTLTVTIETSVVDDTGKTTSKITNVTYTQGSADISTNPATFNSSGKVMTVTNTAKTLPLKVQKVWDLQEGDKPENVVLNFLQNRNQFGVEDQTISEFTNGSSEVITVKDNVPLYIDGKPASYTVQELKIGNTSISEGSYGGDGYRNYDWSQTTTKSDSEILITVTNKKDRGDVEFTKVDQNGNVVSDAGFTVYGDLMAGQPEAATAAVADDTTKKATGSSDGTTGKVTFSSLFTDGSGNTTTGYYYMKETRVPSGYVADSDLYLLQRTDGGAINIYKLQDNNGEKSWGPVPNGQVVNTKRTAYSNITVTKTDNSTTTPSKLVGAEFELTRTGASGTEYYTGADANGVAQFSGTKPGTAVLISAESTGQFSIAGLPAGTYTLTETKAPNGYNLLSYSITINVAESGEVTLSVPTSHTLPTVNDEARSDGTYGHVASFSVTNSTGTALPSTGGSGTTMITLSGLLLMAASLVYGCGLRRRRERRAK